MLATELNSSIESVSMAKRQAALARLYAMEPAASLVTDSAFSQSSVENLRDPLHGQVMVSEHCVPIALHRAIGGEGDGPVPGDILCAALASCMDSSLRVIANRMSIKLQKLEVHVSAEVDVQGALCLDRKVPVGFQSVHVSVDLVASEGTSRQDLGSLLKAAEHCCVVLQTLKNPPTVSTQFELALAGDE